MSTSQRLGQIAYDSYRRYQQSARSELLGAWDDLQPVDQNAWAVAAAAITEEAGRELTRYAQTWRVANDIAPPHTTGSLRASPASMPRSSAWGGGGASRQPAAPRPVKDNPQA